MNQIKSNSAGIKLRTPSHIRTFLIAAHLLVLYFKLPNKKREESPKSLKILIWEYLSYDYSVNFYYSIGSIKPYLPSFLW